MSGILAAARRGLRGVVTAWRANVDFRTFVRQTRFARSGQVRGEVFAEMPTMRLILISIGRLKQGPERELAERYRERFDDLGRKLGIAARRAV